MASARRRRSVYACLLPLVALMGIATRRFPEHLPRVLARYGGDAFWALAVFLLVALLAPRVSTLGAAAVALGLSCLVELSQLYHAPWIDGLRGTTLGGLVLGYEFLWTDLACYTAGVGLGVLLETLVLDPVFRPTPRPRALKNPVPRRIDMDDVLKFIQQRRSIRQYQDAPVSDEQMGILLRAAMAAPSAGNEQAWAFVVISDRERMDRVVEIHPYAGMCKTAARAIVVCGDTSRAQHEGMWAQDCSAATQNLLLAAAGIGLGTCWCGVHPAAEREAAFRELCGLPDHVVPFALIAVGVPAETKGPADYYDPAKVHNETWGA